MFCGQCGTHINDGEHFCSNCGAALQEPGALVSQAPRPVGGGPRRAAGSGTGRRNPRPVDPYKEQIQQLRLQIRQLKLDLRQINNNMGRTRSRYNQGAAFMPWPIREGAKIFEDINLMGSQPQKEQLQQQVMQLERQLLALQQQQAQWKQQQELS